MRYQQGKFRLTIFHCFSLGKQYLALCLSGLILLSLTTTANANNICVSNGGSAICKAPILHDWRYGGGFCHNLTNFNYVGRAQCYALGGDIRNGACINPKPVTNGNIVSIAKTFDKFVHREGACLSTSDSGWGIGGIPVRGCGNYTFIPSWYESGILVTDYRAVSNGCGTYYFTRNRTFNCPVGSTPRTVDGKAVCVEPFSVDFSQCGVGNPILPLSGIKIQTETDFTHPVASLSRLYRSKTSVLPYEATPLPERLGQFGSHWRLSVDYRLYFMTTDVAKFAISFPNGALQYFKEDFAPVTAMHGNGGLRKAGNEFIYQDAAKRLVFSNDGLLTTYQKTGSQPLSLRYADSQLTEIALADGTVLYTLHYGESGRISHIDAASETLTYEYDRQGALSTVSGAEGARREYRYTGSRSFDKLLTEIIDESGNTYAKWTYDLTTGRAESSEHANGTDQYTLSYSVGQSNGNTLMTEVTNPLGKKTTYHYDVINGVSKLTRVEGHQSQHCAAANQAYTYDSNGFMASKTDWNGTVTTYVHNTKGQETSRVEASGTSDARTITTQWHSDFNLPVVIIEPKRITRFTYDDQGRLLNRTTEPYSL